MSSERTENSGLLGLLQRVVDVRRGEVRAMFLACAYFFFVLSSYYVLRPIRDEMGVAGGVRNIPWLFTATLIAMIVANPIFSALVARFPRRKFVPYTYHFFILNLVAFWLMWRTLPESNHVWIGRVFFVWVSVFNLFVVSVFWAFMADIFRTGQGRRLFGFIGVGGTIGGITGGVLTASLVGILGPTNMLLASAGLLELAVVVVWMLGTHADRESTAAGNEPVAHADEPRGDRDAAIGGGFMAGITHVLKSPYLLGIVAYMLLYTIGSTFLYIQQAAIVDQTFGDDSARVTSFFASVDVATNVLTLIIQGGFFGRFVRWLGIAVTLSLVPILSVLGFLSLGLVPTLAVIVVFQILRRAGNYAVARPSRETLFIPLTREDKYKAKSFIDTFVYRAGDQIGAWSQAGMMALGIGVSGIAFVGAGLSAVWVANAMWLGRRNRELVYDEDEGSPGARREEAVPV